MSSRPQANRRSVATSSKIKARLLLRRVVSDEGFYFGRRTRMSRLVFIDATLIRETKRTTGVQIVTGVAHLIHSGDIPLPQTPNYFSSSGLVRKKTNNLHFKSFFVKNGLRNIRSGSKSRVWREERRGCCPVSHRGADPHDQGVVESCPGRHSQSWDHNVRQVKMLHPVPHFYSVWCIL